MSGDAHYRHAEYVRGADLRRDIANSVMTYLPRLTSEEHGR